VGDSNLKNDVWYTSAPTPTPTVTMTPTITGTPTAIPTVTPTFTPVLDCGHLIVSKNLFIPSEGPLFMSVYSGCLTGDHSLKIYNSAGEVVKTLPLLPAGSPTASVTATWDGTNKDGGACASGLYILRFLTDWTVSSRRVILVH
jgi:hypothetical protein